jgi:hypothetical protein
VAPRFPDAARASLAPLRAEVCVFIGDDGVPIKAVLQPGSAPVKEVSEQAALLWRFGPGSVRDRLPAFRLRFVFRVLPQGSDAAEETAVFRPPYEVEVRHAKQAPAVVAER